MQGRGGVRTAGSLSTAQEEIDRLYQCSQCRICCPLRDTAGVAVEHRGEDADASEFENWGPRLVGLVREMRANGIGTCIRGKDTSPTEANISGSRHTNLSCLERRFFGQRKFDGGLGRPRSIGCSERANALTGALTVNSARAIEERFFESTTNLWLTRHLRRMRPACCWQWMATKIIGATEPRHLPLAR
jgi:transcriptional regulator of acetoin/glycerol metabolism